MTTTAKFKSIIISNGRAGFSKEFSTTAWPAALLTVTAVITMAFFIAAAMFLAAAPIAAAPEDEGANKAGVAAGAKINPVLESLKKLEKEIDGLQTRFATQGTRPEEALKIAETLAEKLSDHGDTLLAMGHVASAGASYYSAVRFNQKNYRALNGLGYSLLQQGYYEQAAISFNQSLTNFPATGKEKDLILMKYNLLNNLGICLIEMGALEIGVQEKLLYTRAANILKDAIKLRPDINFAHYNLGRIYEARELFDSAADCYGDALKANKNDVEACLSMVRLFNDKLKKSKESAKFLKKAIEDNPNAMGLNFLLGESLIAEKSLSEAFFHFWTEFFINPATKWSRDSLDKIKELMVTEFDRIDVKDPLHLYLSGYRFFQEKQYDKALEAYRKACALAPRNVILKLMMADTLKAMEKYKEAIDTHVEAIQLSSKRQAFLYYELANTLMKIKQFDRAAELFSDAISLNPMSVQAYINKSICLLEAKRPEKAVEVLLASLAYFPNSTFVHFHLGKALFQSRRPDLARKEFEYILGKQTGDEIKKAAKAFIETIDRILGSEGAKVSENSKDADGSAKEDNSTKKSPGKRKKRK